MLNQRSFPSTKAHIKPAIGGYGSLPSRSKRRQNKTTAFTPRHFKGERVEPKYDATKDLADDRQRSNDHYAQLAKRNKSGDTIRRFEHKLETRRNRVPVNIRSEGGADPDAYKRRIHRSSRRKAIRNTHVERNRRPIQPGRYRPTRSLKKKQAAHNGMAFDQDSLAHASQYKEKPRKAKTPRASFVENERAAGEQTDHFSTRLTAKTTPVVYEEHAKHLPQAEIHAHKNKAKKSTFANIVSWLSGGGKHTKQEHSNIGRKTAKASNTFSQHKGATHTEQNIRTLLDVGPKVSVTDNIVRARSVPQLYASRSAHTHVALEEKTLPSHAQARLHANLQPNVHNVAHTTSEVEAQQRTKSEHILHRGKRANTSYVAKGSAAHNKDIPTKPDLKRARTTTFSGSFKTSHVLPRQTVFEKNRHAQHAKLSLSENLNTTPVRQKETVHNLQKIRTTTHVDGGTAAKSVSSLEHVRERVTESTYAEHKPANVYAQPRQRYNYSFERERVRTDIPDMNESVNSVEYRHLPVSSKVRLPAHFPLREKYYKEHDNSAYYKQQNLNVRM